VLNVNLFSYY